MQYIELSDTFVSHVLSIDEFVSKNRENFFLICDKKEIESISKTLDIDENLFKQKNIADKENKYSYYDNYDSMSFVFITKERHNIEFNILLFSDKIILVYGKKNDDVNNFIDFISNIIKQKISKFMSKKNSYKNVSIWASKIFSIILDVTINQYSMVLENIEDGIQNYSIKLNTNKKIDEKIFEDIVGLRDHMYILRKQIRSLSNICMQISEDNDNDYIPEDLQYLFKGINYRCLNLLRFAESIYTFSEECIHTYDTKINNKTNTIMKRLTAWTIIFSVWMIVGGLYGMNFKYMPELNYKYGYLVVIAFLIVTSIILFIIFKIKKWL